MSHSAPHRQIDGGADDPGTVWCSPRGEVAHLDPDCWILDGLDAEAHDPTDAGVGRVCEDCRLRAKLRAALRRHRGECQ